MADRTLVINKEKLAYGTMKKIFSDEKFLRKAHLKVPEITKLFIELKKIGYGFKDLPLTIDEAIKCIKESNFS